jgi:hypothetical protein
MFLDFFFALRDQGFPVSPHEYLLFLEGLDRGLTEGSVDDFYYLSRATFVKHEVWLDRFDLIFERYFRGQMTQADLMLKTIPEDWLRRELERVLSPQEILDLEQNGGMAALLERLSALLHEQKERHAGGNTWIGTAGTSPFGQGGAAADGIKLGDSPGQRSGTGLWNRRDFQNLDDSVELNTRNLKLALRKLRLLTREGREDELDLNGTIRRTSENAGMLDIAMRASRRNRVKVLLLMDVGGSMYEHVQACEQLFSAARHAFQRMESYYFHNCIYGHVWKDNRRRQHQRTPTLELLARFKRDFKVIIIGDAAMAPSELHWRGGSTEHHNDEAGSVWLSRIRDHFDHVVWLNPNPDYGWSYFSTTKDIRELFGKRMFPLTLDGLGRAMKALNNPALRYEAVWVDD